MQKLWVLSGLGHALLWMRDAFKHYSLEFSAKRRILFLQEVQWLSVHMPAGKHGCFKPQLKFNFLYEFIVGPKAT